MEKVEILMNWSCNENCIFCSVADNFEQGGIKPWSEIKEVIDNASGEANMISISGGEPTIRKDIFRTIEYAKEKGFDKIEVQSNGMMFSNEEFLDQLIDRGVSRFLVSIHSHKPEVHNFLTRVDGSWKRTVEGIENIKERDKEVRVSIVVNKYNYKDLPDMAEFLHERFGELFAIHFNYVMPQGNAKGSFEDLAPKLEDARPYIEETVQYLKGVGESPWLHNVYPCIMGEEFEPFMTEIILTDTELYGPDFECEIDEQRYSFREKPDSCDKCKYNKVCVGPPSEYLETFGEGEFKPIKGEEKTHNDIQTQDY